MQEKRFENWTWDKFFEPEDPYLRAWLASKAYPWELLPDIGNFISDYLTQLDLEDFVSPAEDVYIHKSVKVPPTATIIGPCLILEKAQIRPGCYIRGKLWAGPGAVLGNSCEFKNCVLMQGAEVPHFSYVGDSILGKKAHLGGGAVTSNYRQDHQSVKIRFSADPDTKAYETGLRKMGAIIGDYAEIGSQTVLNPGSLVGRKSRVYPLVSLRHAVGPNTIYKGPGRMADLEERE